MTTRIQRLAFLAIPAGLIFLQVLISLPRLRATLIEDRPRWHNDDASMLLRAIHSADAVRAAPLAIFGLARYERDGQGKVSGLSHYSHHPVLPAFLFRGFTAVVGYGDWVPGTYALLWSCLITLLLFALSREATGSRELAGALTLLYLLLPLNFNYQDVWKHETVTTAAILGAFLLFRHVERPNARRLLLPAIFLLFQSGWTAYLPGLALLVLIARRDQSLSMKAALAAAVGILANFAILHALGFTPTEIRHHAGYRMGSDMDLIVFQDWLSRQLEFLDLNFGQANMVLLAGLALFFLVEPRQRRSPLTVFGLSVAAATAAWVVCFRNLSQIYHYAQWHLGLAYLLVLTGAMTSLRREKVPVQLLLIGLIPLLGLSLYKATTLERAIHVGRFCEPEDLRAIRGETHRLIISLDDDSGPKEWWNSPSLLLYSDALYKTVRGDSSGVPIRGGIAYAAPHVRLDPDSDVVVALKNGDSIRRFSSFLKENCGVASLTPYLETPTFIFLRIGMKPRRAA